MNFIKERPTKPGPYMVRTIAWRGANIEKKTPGFYKYHYMTVDISKDDDTKELLVWLIKYDKPILLSSNIFDDFEWCKVEYPIDLPTIPNPLQPWEVDAKPYDIPAKEIIDEILERFKNGQK